MQINNSRIAYNYIRPLFRKDVEEFWCIALNSRLMPIEKTCLFRGTVDLCFSHPRELFRFAYQFNASNLIVFHNHPSGECQPSPQDIIWTKRLVLISNIMSIPIIDHIILGKKDFYSCADNGLMQMKNSAEIIDHILEVPGEPPLKMSHL